MRKYFCFSSCLLFACLSPLNTQQSSDKKGILEQQLLANEKEIWDLSIRDDFQGWSQLISDDALAVYDTGYASKADVLEAIRGWTAVTIRWRT